MLRKNESPTADSGEYDSEDEYSSVSGYTSEEDEEVSQDVTSKEGYIKFYPGAKLPAQPGPDPVKHVSSAYESFRLFGMTNYDCYGNKEEKIAEKAQASKPATEKDSDGQKEQYSRMYQV